MDFERRSVGYRLPHAHMAYTTQLTDGLYMFDLYEQGLPGRSSAYVYRGAKNVLIDTGSAPCHSHIIRALSELGLEPHDLHYVILTHIHLDHAGGAGTLARLAPSTTFVVHPRAARHLIDPTKLMTGARAVYGEDTDRYFGEVLPVPEHQVLIRQDGETLDFGDRIVTFYDTPGHAKHHFSMYDPVLQSIFVGDALGIRYVHRFTGWPFEFVLPSTSPSDFDPEAVVNTVAKLSALHATTVYHTHYGPSPIAEALSGTLLGAKRFAAMADRIYHKDVTWEDVKVSLESEIRSILTESGHKEPHHIEDLGLDLELDAKGLLYYEEKKHAPH